MALKTCFCWTCGNPAEEDEFDHELHECIDCAYVRADAATVDLSVQSLVDEILTIYPGDLK